MVKAAFLRSCHYILLDENDSVGFYLKEVLIHLLGVFQILNRKLS